MEVPGLQGQMELLVLLEQMGLREQLDQRVQQVLMVLPVQLGQQDHKERLELLG